MPATDYYEILGLKKGATEKEIRTAFRKLARTYHPDVNPGDKAAEARFKDINEANEVLSDPQKRALYDELGPRYQEYEQYRANGGTATASEFARATSGMRGGGQAGSPFDTRTMSDQELHDIMSGGAPFSDFFRNAFGADAASTRRTSGSGSLFKAPGQDIDHEVEISLEEAMKGTSRLVQYADSRGTRRIEAAIPAGAREGSRIRLAGQGGRGRNGGPNGDLYLVIHLKAHELFEVRGADIYVDIPVELHICMLGGEVLVPTPKGSRLALTIPAESQNGRQFRLSGQGLPSLKSNGKAGDLYATLRVVLPTQLSDEERELFRKLAQARTVRSAT